MTDTLKCFDPDCQKNAVSPVWLIDDTGHVWPFCSEACAEQPWPMTAFDGNEPADAAQLYAQQQRQRERDALQMALATRSADDLRAIVAQLDDEKFALTERNAHLEEQHLMLMGELEDAIGVRDSLSSQVDEVNARLNVHKKKFPAMLYHRDGKTCVVQTPEAKRALVRTGEWFDHPDKAEASRQRAYNLKKPADVVINDTPDGKLAAMSPKERQTAIGQALKGDAAHRRTVDDSRIDVHIDVLDRPKLPDGQ